MGQDRRTAGFRDRTPVSDARSRLLEAVAGHGRTEQVALGDADGRVVAEPLASRRPVPHYRRAAMDGYAVRAEDTFGATDRSPAVLRPVAADEVGPGTAVRVHTGSELPAGADAVVMVEDVEAVGDRLEVFAAAAEGANVAPVGEDVAEGQPLYGTGDRLSPSDLGLLKSVGVDGVEVYERPRVSVVPTGEELVQEDPAAGEVVETNGATVSRLVERWGGDPSYRGVVTDDPESLRAAVERDLDHDLVVTTGGSSVGARDYLPEVLAEAGTVLVHGVALAPGYPVACLVNAVQFLRPALKRAGHLPCPSPPTRTATLSRKLSSEAGTRTFARVRLEDGAAVPTRAGGAGVLSSVALSDGWVVVPESREGYGAGTAVEVELWEWSA